VSNNTSSIAKPMNCPHCGRIHEGQRCPAVKAIEYYPDGKIKRVEYHMQDLGGRYMMPSFTRSGTGLPLLEGTTWS
jgi:hypothetical protein